MLTELGYTEPVTAVHRLARMDAFMGALTYVVGPLPLVMFFAGFYAPAPTSYALYGVTAFLALIWGSVWFYWRPKEFVIDGTGLTIRWPLREMHVPGETISGVRTVSKAEFKSEFGWYYRVGAGGLWGAFGWLKTRKRGMVPTFVSRMSGWVLVDRDNDAPILLSPNAPARFVELLS